MAGFWERVESWLLDVQKDRQRVARYFFIAYWISVLFVAVGAVIILLSLAGVWSP